MTKLSAARADRLLSRRSAIASISAGIATLLAGNRNAIANSLHAAQGEGRLLWPAEQSNPLNARVIALTVVTSELDHAASFYKAAFGMSVVGHGMIDGDAVAPGFGNHSRRYVTLAKAEDQTGAHIRLLEAPASSAPNRPRPGSTPIDPGLALMQCEASDPALSYHRLASLDAPVVSSPRYALFYNTVFGSELSIMSYSPFGPAGEQLLIHSNIRNDRPDPPFQGLHSDFSKVVLTCLNQRDVEAFYDKVFGLKRTTQARANQRNINDVLGIPEGSYFWWGQLGTGVEIEVWEMKAQIATMYPSSLAKTGLAMFTLQVNDLARCKDMCKRAEFGAVSGVSLPLRATAGVDGFYVRGAVGELIEVVGT